MVALPRVGDYSSKWDLTVDTTPLAANQPAIFEEADLGTARAKRARRLITFCAQRVLPTLRLGLKIAPHLISESKRWRPTGSRCRRRRHTTNGRRSAWAYPAGAN